MVSTRATNSPWRSWALRASCPDVPPTASGTWSLVGSWTTAPGRWRRQQAAAGAPAGPGSPPGPVAPLGQPCAIQVTLRQGRRLRSMISPESLPPSSVRSSMSGLPQKPCQGARTPIAIRGCCARRPAAASASGGCAGTGRPHSPEPTNTGMVAGDASRAPWELTATSWKRRCQGYASACVKNWIPTTVPSMPCTPSAARALSAASPMSAPTATYSVSPSGPSTVTE